MDVGYRLDPDQRRARQQVQSRWLEVYAPIRHLDPVLVLSALALSGIGLVAIYSAKLVALTSQGLPTSLYVSRQLLALAIGVVAMVIIALIDYHWLRVYSWVLYLGAVVLLALVLSPLGSTIGGSQRWIVLGGFQLQPSELAKVAVVLAVAAILHASEGRPGFGAVAASLVVALVPTVLVFLQPDLGTSLVFVWVVAVLLLLAGVHAGYLVGLGISGVVFAVVALVSGLIQPYQLTRLTAFLEAGEASAAQTAAFQTRQSLIAVGSGRFAGKGLFEGTQTSLSYVPENHTDFIFTVIAEELGFLGGGIVLGLLLLVVWRGLRIAILAKDRFGMLVAGGIVAILTLQAFVNIGMTIGIMPVTGLPLPFVSYGGTSLIVWFSMIGLLLNIHMRRF
ncbi:MAG: rod shape-determining protein RodA [Nitriliruptoraceae bacterium]